nr:MAG TPA: antitoxin [Caudoviricetes sp.]
MRGETSVQINALLVMCERNRRMLMDGAQSRNRRDHV